MTTSRGWISRLGRSRRPVASGVPAGVPAAVLPASVVPHAVAFEAIAAQLAHDRGELSHAELVAALTAIVSDVVTLADVFDLLARVVTVATSSLESAARCVGAEPEELLRVAALEFAAARAGSAPA